MHPQIPRDGSGWVVKLHEDDELSDVEAAEMEEIVETLKSGIFEPWELYPHQKESLKAYLLGSMLWSQRELVLEKPRVS